MPEVGLRILVEQIKVRHCCEVEPITKIIMIRLMGT